MLGWEQGRWKAALGGCKGAPGAAAELGATGATMGWGQPFFLAAGIRSPFGALHLAKRERGPGVTCKWLCRK